MTYKYRKSGNNVAIFRVVGIPEHGISTATMIFWQNIEESCKFQKMYGVGKVKLHTNFQVDSKKHKFSRKR